MIRVLILLSGVLLGLKVAGVLEISLISALTPMFLGLSIYFVFLVILAIALINGSNKSKR